MSGTSIFGFDVDQWSKKEPFIAPNILAEMEQGDFRNLYFVNLSQEQIAKVLLKSTNTKDDLKVHIIETLFNQEKDTIKAIIQSWIFDQKLKKILLNVNSGKLFWIFIELSDSEDIEKETWEAFINKYGSIISEIFLDYLKSCKPHKEFTTITDTICNISVQNNPILQFLKTNFEENLAEFIGGYRSYSVAESYDYIKKYNANLLNNTAIQLYLLRKYNPFLGRIGESKEVSEDHIVSFLFSHIYKLPKEEVFTLLDRRIRRNPQQLIKLIATLKHLETHERILLWETILWWLIEVDIGDSVLEKKIISEMQASLLKEIYDKKDSLWKAYIAHFSRKWFQEFSFIDNKKKECSGLTCFFTSKWTIKNLQKFMSGDEIKFCSPQQLLKLISHKDFLKSPRFQEYILNNPHKHLFEEKIDKEDQITLIKNNFNNFDFLCKIFHLQNEEKISLYKELPDHIEKKVKKIVFDSIHFDSDQWLDFVRYYPGDGFIDYQNIRRNSPQHLFVEYSKDYEILSKKYYTSKSIKDKIDKEIFSKLQWKVLVDIWSGGKTDLWIGVAKTVLPAIQANASAYIGIDVHSFPDLYDEKQIELIIEKYGLDASCKNHNIMIKPVFDNFETFLERVPSAAGYNFTINGLCLTSSISSIKKHINRIMRPWNIILANAIQNINIEDILEGPFKYTAINLWPYNKIHMYEKLSERDI